MISFCIRLFAWLQNFFICWQNLGLSATLTVFVFSRYSESVQSITLPNGLKFFFRGKLDKGVLSHFYVEGYYLSATQEAPITTILDAGANIGDETARFNIHYPGAEVIAVEPASCNFDVLKQNFDHLKNVSVVEGALWSRDTFLRIEEGTSMESFRVLETEESEGALKAWTIPMLMAIRGWETIDILKLDIEGGEYELFSRNTEDWIDKVNSFIFEVPDYDLPGSSQVIYRALAHRDMMTYSCGENLILVDRNVPWVLQKVLGLYRG